MRGGDWIFPLEQAPYDGSSRPQYSGPLAPRQSQACKSEPTEALPEEPLTCNTKSSALDPSALAAIGAPTLARPLGAALLAVLSALPIGVSGLTRNMTSPSLPKRSCNKLRTLSSSGSALDGCEAEEPGPMGAAVGAGADTPAVVAPGVDDETADAVLLAVEGLADNVPWDLGGAATVAGLDGFALAGVTFRSLIVLPEGVWVADGGVWVADGGV